MNQREMEKKIWESLLNSEELNNTNEEFIERLTPNDSAAERRRFGRALHRVVEIIQNKAW